MRKVALLLVVIVLFNLCSCNKKGNNTQTSSYDEVFDLEIDNSQETSNSSEVVSSNTKEVENSSDKTTSSKETKSSSAETVVDNKNTSTTDNNSSNDEIQSASESTQVTVEVSKYNPDDDPTKSKVTCNHPQLDGSPTCEKYSVCLVCGDVVEPALGHNFVNGVCNRQGCNAAKQKWYSADNQNISLSEIKEILSINYQKPKNVILMIGDGMGPNDIILAEKHNSSCFSFGLILNQIINTGFSTTYSNSSSVTDSAAAGTALATGVKTNNGRLCVSPDGEDLKNISQYARERGKKVGIVTNDKATGATPSAFGVHVNSRKYTSLIAEQMVSFAPDLFMGQNIEDFSGQNLKKFVVSEDISAYETALNKFDLKCELPFWGFASYNTTYNMNNLNRCTDIALNYLKKCSPNGFFLMVENTTCDNAGHNKSIEGKLNGVVSLDRAIVPVLRFMKDNPDTLLVITSDHECGGVTIPSGDYDLNSSLFTTDSHTGVEVRTFAVGYGTEYFRDKTVDNTDIGKFLINAVCN